jgi:hypothetical protein
MATLFSIIVEKGFPKIVFGDITADVEAEIILSWDNGAMKNPERMIEAAKALKQLMIASEEFENVVLCIVDRSFYAGEKYQRKKEVQR